MNESIRLGSQLFINKDETPEQVRNWVIQMKSYGLTVIRLFMIWEQLEPKRGQWSFDNYDACFDEAARQGMTIVPTLMSISPPGWMRLTDGPQGVADLDDPAFMEKSKEYLRTIVGRYREHPAMDSWILWNEACREIYRSPHAIQAYAKHLEERYGTIESYNDVSYEQYESFEHYKQAEQERTVAYQQPFKSFIDQLEWYRFTVSNLSSQLRFVRDEIRAIDPIHPVHVNPHKIQTDLQSLGQSIWEESEIVDFMGCSAHPTWHSVRFPSDRWSQSVAMFSDLMRSATKAPDRKFWVTELQGGTTLFSAEQAFTPSKADIRKWIWEGIGSGAKAVVFWCFNARNGGYEAAEWSLLNQMGESSPRLEAVREVADLLERRRELFDSCSPSKGKVMILFSETSSLLGTIEGQGNDPSNPRNRNMVLDAVGGAYLMLSDLSIEAEFINEKRLARDGVPDGIQALIVPNAIVLSLPELDAIERFVRLGGLVIADGLTGMKDANGKIDQASLNRAGSLFGARARDIEILRDVSPIVTSDGEASFPGWFYGLPLKVEEEATAVGAFEDGRPAMVQRRYGEGTTLRIGTCLFQSYYARPQPELLAFLKRQLEGRVDRGVGLGASSGDRVRLRRLDTPDGHVLVLINEGEGAEAEIVFPGTGRATDLNGDRTYAIAEPEAALRLPIGKDEVKLLHYERG